MAPEDTAISYDPSGDLRVSGDAVPGHLQGAGAAPGMVDLLDECARGRW
jgi:hypothetical protein